MLTIKQQQIVEKYKELSSSIKVAKFFEIDDRNVRRAISKARRLGLLEERQQEGYQIAVPEGFKVYQQTTHVQVTDESGVVKNIWHRSAPPEQQKSWDAWVKAIESYTQENLKPVKPVKSPVRSVADLLNLYVITDFHMGMLAYAPETGDDWDTNIAKNVLINAIKEMAERSPDAEEGLFCELGDFLHFDSLESITPTSGHLLDSDTRYDRLVDVTLSTMIECVDILARKHKKLKVVIAEGNHNLSGSVWVRKALKQVYKNNKRITIDDTCFPYYAHLHGEIMLGFHHGHKVKNKSLPALFASEPRYRDMWGKASYTYIHTGHTHQKEQDSSEYGGAIVERHQTLTSRDAYAARGGWVSKRAANQITYHQKKGEIGRVVVYPDIADYSEHL